MVMVLSASEYGKNNILWTSPLITSDYCWGTTARNDNSPAMCMEADGTVVKEKKKKAQEEVKAFEIPME